MKKPLEASPASIQRHSTRRQRMRLKDTVIQGKAYIDEGLPFVKAYKAAGYSKEYYEATGPLR